MPILITLNAGSDDSWLREQIRGESVPDAQPPKLIYVIMEDTDMRAVDALIARWCRLRLHRGRPFGGSMFHYVDYGSKVKA